MLPQPAAARQAANPFFAMTFQQKPLKSCTLKFLLVFTFAQV
jgi:hypothetical protein